MKTVTVKGKVYQIGEPYKNAENGVVGFLCDYHKDNGFMLFRHPVLEGEYRYCTRVDSFATGTITDAPIEVEKGETWMCHYEIQTESESCEHFELPFTVGLHGGFYGVPANALLFTPKYKMVRERT